MKTNMFCYQCQEAAKGIGCTTQGVCGKDSELAILMDALIYSVKGLSNILYHLNKLDVPTQIYDEFILESLFKTVTNVNFDPQSIINSIYRSFELKKTALNKLQDVDPSFSLEQLPASSFWIATSDEEILKIGQLHGVNTDYDEDHRSLRETLMYGVKGMAAYAYHALHLGKSDKEIFHFIHRVFTSLEKNNLSNDELLTLILECGEKGVRTMALLDEAHTNRYGHPEVTTVSLGVRNRPGILVSGHDLIDLEELLEQSKDAGIDIYTHGEMLPAHYYPFFKKYTHFAGNYGNSWWQQREEFEKFNGPILFTTNCIVPPFENASYKDRIYTTGATGLPNATYIPNRKDGKSKDFSQIIRHAQQCQPPLQLEEGQIVGGFAHHQVLSLADKILAAVNAGKIKKFVVMAGCDGRHKERQYYTEFAQKLPPDTVILTAGCAKYRYIKLPLGNIDGIPRVLDAGQCNDSYSLAAVALKLKEVLGLDDINKLPIVYNIAWYEQKAVIVLLALLYLGVKNIHLGPTLPAFLSPNVLKILQEKFQINTTSTVEEDLKKFELV